MRVLEAITPSRIGGAEVYVSELCRALPEYGIEIDLFCPSGRPFVEFARKRGIESTGWKTHGKFDPITVFKLVKLIKSRNIDVIHTHLSTASLLGALAAKLAGIKSVAHVHGLNSATCYRYSTLVIAVSDAVKKHLVAQGLDSSKIIVISNGVDIERLQPRDKAHARQSMGWDIDTPVFGVFGRLSPEKGQRSAIEAISIAAKSHESARLFLAGDGKDRAELESLARELGIIDRVDFPGFVEDIATAMSACDAILIPSKKEGLPLAALEAMALARPIIASEVGGLPEAVISGETGYLVTPADPKELAARMLDIIADPNSSRQMGERGRARVEENFNSSKQFARVAEELRLNLLHVDSISRE